LQFLINQLMKHTYSLALISLLLLFLSCDDEELEATVPAYLKIDEINFKVNDESVEGRSTSSNIPDAWVFVNDQLIGAFELPALIPILQTGNVNVKVRGGIFNNGLSNQRVVYPFYEFFVMDTLLEKEVIYEPKVNVFYKELTVFNTEWGREDFERGNSFLKGPNSTIGIVPTDNPQKVFEGDRSGALTLPSGTTFAESMSPNLINVPRLGTAVYLEFDYKTTHDIAISIYATDRNNIRSQFSVVNFRPTGDWKKVYVDFSRVFATLFDAQYYNIAFGMVKPSGEEGEFLIDNVKFIHF